LNIRQFHESLQTIDIDNITFSKHFVKRTKERGLDHLADLATSHNMISTEDPAGIVDQENNKFQVLYRHNDKYDVVIIIAVRSTNPFKVSLVTCFPREVERRIK